MSLSAEQFSQLLAVLTNGGGVNTAPAPRIQPKLIAKYFHVEQFRGALAEWDDWSFAFRRTVNSMSPHAYSLMERAENAATDVRELFENTVAVAQDGSSQVVELATDAEQLLRSSELYDILSQRCTGEALSLIKSVRNCSGFRAWQILYKKYNPKTMARGVRLMIEVVNPSKIKSLGEIEAEITKWEEKTTILSSQFGEGINQRMKIAIFTNMMPANIQDYIYSIVENDTQYEALKDKVRGMVSNKVAMNMGPAPMDIGGLLGHGEEEWNEETEVGAVNANTKCYRCQGYGHFSRDCATAMPEKGKGKGQPANPGTGGSPSPWKGSQKGQGKGQEKGKGKGKSFAGTCWKCNQPGHRAYDCTMKVQAVEEDGEEAEVPVGGVWMIGQVEAVWSEKKRVRARRSPAVEMKNRFESLSDNPEEVMIAEVEVSEKEFTRPSGMIFNVADVAKPLAAAVKVCEAGNRVVLDTSEPDLSYVENILTGERMKLTVDRGTFVFEVKYLDDGQEGQITLDSGAGVSVWPKNMKPNLKTLPKKEGLKMVAANGTKIENYGQKVITFTGLKSPFTGRT
jgi:hypothetical protein